MSNNTNNGSKNTPEVPTVSASKQVNAAVNEVIAESKPKTFDEHFTIEHQGFIAMKYAAKYSDADQVEHLKTWPEYKGNSFMLYVLAETLQEAQKAVFSANKKILLNNLLGAMMNFTPMVAGAVLSNLQVSANKLSDMQLGMLAEQVPVPGQRVELLKDYAKILKQSARTGKDTDAARLKFYRAADMLEVLPNLIW